MALFQIEDLKRLNNIHKENEIFAKRTIKVPHHPISLALAGVHSGHNSPNECSTSTKIDSEKLTNSLKETEVNQIIFNSNIAQKTEDNRVDFEDADDEEIQLLPQAAPVIAPRLNCDGTDGDISLKALILCIVILIFVVPLIYVFYIAEHPDQYHHAPS